MTEETIMSSISREERVARIAEAMCREEAGRHYGPAVREAEHTWSDATPYHKEQWTARARAAIAALSVDERLIEALEPLLRFHETGGHEGDGSDERLALIRSLSTTKADQ